MAAVAALLLPVTWAYSTSTRYCRESAGDDAILDEGCPGTEGQPEWPDTLCTVDSEGALCKCPEQPDGFPTLSCLIDQTAAPSFTSGRCSDIIVRVTGTATPVEGFDAAPSADPQLGGITETVYCTNMVKNNQWQPYVREGAGEDSPWNTVDFQKRSDLSWRDYWSCWYWGWWGKTWENGKCWDNDRYLGERCTDDLRCISASANYDEYSTSCKDNTCVMYAEAAGYQRTQCECNWFDWWIWFACASDTCDGHACVLTTQNGNYYCDYATPQGGPLEWFR